MLQKYTRLTTPLQGTGRQYQTQNERVSPIGHPDTYVYSLTRRDVDHRNDCVMPLIV